MDADVRVLRDIEVEAAAIVLSVLPLAVLSYKSRPRIQGGAMGLHLKPTSPKEKPKWDSPMVMA